MRVNVCVYEREREKIALYITSINVHVTFTLLLFL